MEGTICNSLKVWSKSLNSIKVPLKVKIQSLNSIKLRRREITEQLLRRTVGTTRTRSNKHHTHTHRQKCNTSPHLHRRRRRLKGRRCFIQLNQLRFHETAIIGMDGRRRDYHLPERVRIYFDFPLLPILVRK